MSNMSNFNFTGKKIYITGATGMIGSMITRSFLECGGELVVHGTDTSKTDALIKKLRIEYPNANLAGQVYDFRDTNAIRTSVQQLDKIDVLVNCVALRPLTTIQDITQEEWEDTINVNLRGAFVLSQISGAMMCEQGSGSMIHIASIAGVTPPHYYRGVHYIASKHMLIALTIGLAHELGPQGVRVNAISPGPVGATDACSLEGKKYHHIKEFTQLPLTAEAVADTCLFLASKKARYINGENIILGNDVTV